MFMLLYRTDYALGPALAVWLREHLPLLALGIVLQPVEQLANLTMPSAVVERPPRSALPKRTTHKPGISHSAHSSCCPGSIQYVGRIADLGDAREPAVPPLLQLRVRGGGG
jgi:hypothetical protein